MIAWLFAALGWTVVSLLGLAMMRMARDHQYALKSEWHAGYDFGVADARGQVVRGELSEPCVKK